MRMYRTLALGAATLALVMSACSPGGSGSSSEQASAARREQARRHVGSAGFYGGGRGRRDVRPGAGGQGLHRRAPPRDRRAPGRPRRHGCRRDQPHPRVPWRPGRRARPSQPSCRRDPHEAWDNLQEPLDDKGWVAFDFSPGTDADGFAVRQETADRSRPGDDERPRRGGRPAGLGPRAGLPGQPGLRPWPERRVRHRHQPARRRDAGAVQHRDGRCPEQRASIDVAQVCTTQPDIVSFNFVAARRRQASAAGAEHRARSPRRSWPTRHQPTSPRRSTRSTRRSPPRRSPSWASRSWSTTTDMADVAQKFLEDNGLL